MLVSINCNGLALNCKCTYTLRELYVNSYGTDFDETALHFNKLCLFSDDCAE